MHQKFMGTSQSDAEDMYLREAQTLNEYGVIFHRVNVNKKRGNGNPCMGGGNDTGRTQYIGCEPRGVIKFEDVDGVKHAKEKYPWKRIEQMQSKRNKITIKLHPPQKHERHSSEPVVVLAESPKQAEYILARLRALHQFWLLVKDFFADTPAAIGSPIGTPMRQLPDNHMELPVSALTQCDPSPALPVITSRSTTLLGDSSRRPRLMTPPGVHTHTPLHQQPQQSQHLQQPHHSAASDVSDLTPLTPTQFTNNRTSLRGASPGDTGSISSAADAMNEMRMAAAAAKQTGRSQLEPPEPETPASKTRTVYKYVDRRQITVRKAQDGSMGFKVGTTQDEHGHDITLVREIEAGKVAHQDGQLRKNDRFYEINGVDVTHAQHDYIRSLIQQSGNEVTFVVATRKKAKVRDKVMQLEPENQGQHDDDKRAAQVAMAQFQVKLDIYYYLYSEPCFRWFLCWPLGV